MSNSTPSLPDLWEDCFSVAKPGEHDGPPSLFAIVEAEGSEVAYAHSGAAAKVIALALNRAWKDRA
jgi:hypothetical protein